jgi:hypothetical protein
MQAILWMYMKVFRLGYNSPTSWDIEAYAHCLLLFVKLGYNKHALYTISNWDRKAGRLNRLVCRKMYAVTSRGIEAGILLPPYVDVEACTYTLSKAAISCRNILVHCYKTCCDMKHFQRCPALINLDLDPPSCTCSCSCFSQPWPLFLHGN